jgi:hypothetical protein
MEPRDVVKSEISSDIGNSTFHVGFPPVTFECATPLVRPARGGCLYGDMMDDLKRYSITEARLRFGELVKQTKYQDKAFVITSYNIDMAYVVPESMIKNILNISDDQLQ